MIHSNTRIAIPVLTMACLLTAGFAAADWDEGV